MFDRGARNGAIDESELKLLLAELDTADLDDATMRTSAQATRTGTGDDGREFAPPPRCST